MDIPYFGSPSRPDTPQSSATTETGTGTGTANAAAAAATETPNSASTSTEPEHAGLPTRQTLDEEVASVLAGLGSFWGRVRQQSASVLKDAEKQMEQYTASAKPFVDKARENFDHFSENARAEITRLSQATPNDAGIMFGADGTPIVLDEVSPVARTASVKGKEKATDQDEGTAVHGEDTSTPAEATMAFLNRLQGQLSANPNVKELSKNLSTLQTTVSSNLSQLPHSLRTNLEQLQTQFAHIDLSDSQKVAEAYLHKGEHWLQEFSQEVTRLAKDAVTIVPPTGSANATSQSETTTRKDMLLAALRNSPQALLVDPAQPPSGPAKVDTRESYAQFLQSIEDSGGLEGEAWLTKIKNETKTAGDKGLNSTFIELVPNTLSAEAFWTRYFFRVSEIERDDANRRRVIESARQVDEADFSWDADEEEDHASASDKVPATTHTATDKAKNADVTPESTTPSAAAETASGTPRVSMATARDAPSSSSDNEWGQSDAEDKAAASASSVAAQKRRDTSNTTSPRASSDGTGSYDVVNAASGAPSEVARSTAGDDDDAANDSDWE